MSKGKKNAKVGHNSGSRVEPTRERVLLYRDGKLRLVWRTLDR